MKLIPDLHSIEQGEVFSIPFSLRKHLASWTKHEYRKYHFGQVLVQEFTHHQFSIFRWLLQIERKTHLYALYEKPAISLQFILAGMIATPGGGGDETTITAPRHVLVNVPKSMHEIGFEPGLYEMIHFELDRGFLQDIALEYHDIRDIPDFIDRFYKRRAACNIPYANYMVRALIADLLSCTEKGVRLYSAIEKCIMLLLKETIREATQHKKNGPAALLPGQPQMPRIHEEIISFANIREHTAEIMSQKYKVPAHVLAENFKTSHGCSLQAFVRFHALTKAHFLVGNTNRTLHDIMLDVGFTFSGNFNQAFKKQFNTTPAVLREESRAQLLGNAV